MIAAALAANVMIFRLPISTAARRRRAYDKRVPHASASSVIFIFRNPVGGATAAADGASRLIVSPVVSPPSMP